MNKDDSLKTLAELKTWVQKFCEDRQWGPYHGPKDLAIGLVTESAELLELFRFVAEPECIEKLANPAFREQVADELADSIYFILRFAQLYNFDLSTAVAQKLKKNAQKYPANHQ